MIYSQGTAERIEDGAILNHPFFGVIDCFSAPYVGKPQLFENLSGGEVIKQIVLETFYSASPQESLETVTLRANARIAEFHSKMKIPLERADLLNGACFALAKIEKEKVTILQGGDCLVFWITSHLASVIVDNNIPEYERETSENIKEILRKYGGDREKLWKEYLPILSRLRREKFNKEFAIFNGQEEVKSCWQEKEIPIKNLRYLILLTDGLMPFWDLLIEGSLSQEKVLIRLVKIFLSSGLKGLLKEVREKEEKRKKELHIDHQEATAIAIKFSP
jgi:serine/threonine protein phosphatase PrpC